MVLLPCLGTTTIHIERGVLSSMSTIGSKLKTLRKGRGLTQLQLAHSLNWSRATISNYECGRRVPHLDELTALCYFFGVSMDYWGVSTEDAGFELLSRAKAVFTNQAIPKEEREKLYKEIMKMYLEM
jgi:transcriptional regulator with XRE-family HTH domain